jgi:transcriptional regulator with XRE-family HTH domain
MSALSERLKDAKGTRGLDDIVRLAEREGHTIHRSVVARYLKGQHGPRPSDHTIAALAAGLRVDVRELRALAGMPPGELGTYEPTPEAARLNREQRDALDQLIRTIVRKGETNARSAAASKKSPGGDPVDVTHGKVTARVASRSRRQVPRQ